MFLFSEAAVLGRIFTDTTAVCDPEGAHVVTEDRREHLDERAFLLESFGGLPARGDDFGHIAEAPRRVVLHPGSCRCGSRETSRPGANPGALARGRARSAVSSLCAVREYSCHGHHCHIHLQA